MMLLTVCDLIDKYIIDNVDKSAMQVLFDEFDVDKDGKITVNQLEQLLDKLGDSFNQSVESPA